jgi:hypothetical protein
MKPVIRCDRTIKQISNPLARVMPDTVRRDIDSTRHKTTAPLAGQGSSVGRCAFSQTFSTGWVDQFLLSFDRAV